MSPEVSRASRAVPIATWFSEYGILDRVRRLHVERWPWRWRALFILVQVAVLLALAWWVSVFFLIALAFVVLANLLDVRRQRLANRNANPS
jgi:uncharacterized membrane protein YhaH (DUF805 family)